MMYFLEILAIGLILLGILYEDVLIEIEDLLWWCIKNPRKALAGVFKWYSNRKGEL